jgi:hypothetical protein
MKQDRQRACDVVKRAERLWLYQRSRRGSPATGLSGRHPAGRPRQDAFRPSPRTRTADQTTQIAVTPIVVVTQQRTSGLRRELSAGCHHGGLNCACTCNPWPASLERPVYGRVSSFLFGAGALTICATRCRSSANLDVGETARLLAACSRVPSAIHSASSTNVVHVRRDPPRRSSSWPHE